MKGPPYPKPVRPWVHTRAGGAIALLLSALVAGCIGPETDDTSVPITRTSNKAPIVPGYESMRVANVADAAALGERSGPAGARCIVCCPSGHRACVGRVGEGLLEIVGWEYSTHSSKGTQ